MGASAAGPAVVSVNVLEEEKTALKEERKINNALRFFVDQEEMARFLDFECPEVLDTLMQSISSMMVHYSNPNMKRVHRSRVVHRSKSPMQIVFHKNHHVQLPEDRSFVLFVNIWSE